MSKVVSLRGDALPPDDPPAESVPDFLRRLADTAEANSASGAVLILDDDSTAGVFFSDSIAEQPVAVALGLLEFVKFVLMEVDGEG